MKIILNTYKCKYRMYIYDAEKEVTVKPKNPYACFGRKPHPMDFDDRQEYEFRMGQYEKWEKNNN